jgi:hypothetical protein
MENKVFGNFTEIHTRNSDYEYLVIGFSPTSTPFQQRWRNNSLAANFLSDYLSNFLNLGKYDNNCLSVLELRSAISYIANELLENAMKHGYTSSAPITIQLLFADTEIIFLITNMISLDAVNKFQPYIHLLLGSDTQKLYFEQIEKEHVNGAGLGLLSILNDYPAKIGWKFEHSDKEKDTAMTLTTMVQLDI